MITGTIQRATRPLVVALLILGAPLLFSSCNSETQTNPEPEPRIDPPAAPTLTIDYKPVRMLSFSWDGMAEETKYTLLEDRGDGIMTPVADIPANTRQYDLETFLPAAKASRFAVQACNEGGCSTSSPVQTSPDDLALIAGYFKATAPSSIAQFGIAIAISGDGKVFAVGAPLTDYVDIDSGVVYVYRKEEPGVWKLNGVLGSSIALDGYLNFGSAVALSYDGSVLAIGMSGDANDSGSVYVLTYDGEQWREQARVTASNSEPKDFFGSALALSGDGKTLAVGAFGEDSAATGVNGDQNDNSANNSGAVYIFTQGAGGWSQQAYLKSPDVSFNSNDTFGDNFGRSLAISAEGNTLVVGAMYEDSNAAGVGGDESDNSLRGSGAAYVFVRDDANNWSQQAYLKASFPDSGDFFGRSVAISADGGTVAVGADHEDGDGLNENSDSAPESGAVYVFTRDDGGGWQGPAYIKTATANPDAMLGFSLALSADGNTLAAGAPWEENQGAVYLFERDDAGVWNQPSYSKVVTYAGDHGDVFGSAIALAADGHSLVVGAPEEDSGNDDPNDNTLSDSGAVYLY